MLVMIGSGRVSRKEEGLGVAENERARERLRLYIQLYACIRTTSQGFVLAGTTSGRAPQ